MAVPGQALLGGVAARSGDVAVTLEQVTVGFPRTAAHPTGTPILAIERLDANRGERVGVVGPNGAGKTTLLRTVAGDLPVLDGFVRLGANATPGYLAQVRDAPIPGTTVLDAILAAGRIETTPARSYLARFLFQGEDVLKSVAELSGSERSRLGSGMGAAVTTPKGTLDAIADDQRHRVRVAVIVERVSGDALVETTALEVEWPADEIGVRPLLFANIRPEGFRGTGVLIGDILEGTTSYVPLLTYGDSATYGDQIRFGTGTDVVGQDPLSGAESEPTAQWLEVTVSSPDAAPVTTRREVFDRVGPVARAAGAFDPTALGLAELAPSGEAGREDFLPALTVHWLTVSTGTLGGEALRTAFEPTEEPEGYGLAASLYHVVRDVAGLEGALPAGVHAVVNAPNVVGMVARPFLDTDGTTSMAGWWLVDPATGRTWDELDDGRGSGGLADEALLIQNIIKTHPAWLILRVCLVGAAILAASFLGLVVAGQLDSGAAMGAFGGAAASARLPDRGLLRIGVAVRCRESASAGVLPCGCSIRSIRKEPDREVPPPEPPLHASRRA